MNKTEVFEIINKSLSRIENNNYKGYDPADLLSSEIEVISKLPISIKRILTLINVYSPINFRSILKIKPRQNTTAMIMLGRIYLNLYKYEPAERYKEKIDNIVDWLLKNAISDNQIIGWSRTIDYQSKTIMHSPNSSLTFLNANAGELFFELYEIFKKEDYLNILVKICNNFVTNTNIVESNEGKCLTYTNDGGDEILNASILAGKILNKTGVLLDNGIFISFSIDILKDALSKQNKDGSWYYSHKKKKKLKKQIDFHQVYVLDGIIGYVSIPDSELLNQRDECYKRGVSFYINNMFDKNMIPYWRYPIKFPTDIHNLSHAIYFFSKYKKYLIKIDDNYFSKMKLLYKMISKDFYNKNDNYFYYQSYYFFKLKHDFFRWNTVWTLFGLSCTLVNEGN